jgi:uncharacterized protein with von Willebrand factor type A (vWA) domain
MTLSELKAEGRLVENIVHFARALRKAGVKVGTAQLENAIRAVAEAGFTHRVDFYHILRATLITRADHLEVYHQVFSMFWRDPEFLDSLIHMMSPRLKDDSAPPPPSAAQRRAEDALGDRDQPKPPPKPKEEIVRHALLSWSETEVLRGMDFEQMTAAELAEAERAVRDLKLPVKPIRTRRTRRNPAGPKPDVRATLRAASRKGGEIERLARRAALTRQPDLIALCDISGSMSIYSRMVIRYLHAMAHAPVRSWGHVHAFTFGTRLTNVTRALRLPEPDAALASIGQEARDWDGGTRIGAAIGRFNKDWSRRVLGSGAVVLLISDGLERGGTDLLDQEAARLARSARHLFWLNPLLRFDRFAPKAQGVRILLEHVDSFHACHSLDSLAGLSEALGQPGLRDRYRREARTTE